MALPVDNRFVYPLLWEKHVAATEAAKNAEIAAAEAAAIAAEAAKDGVARDDADKLALTATSRSWKTSL